MKLAFKIALFLSTTLTFFAFSVSPDPVERSKPTTIKILLHRQISELILEAKGRYSIYNPLDGSQVFSGIVSRRHPITTEPYGIRWGEKFPGYHQLRFVPGDSQSTLLVNGIQYKGSIEVYHHDGKFNVINEVDIDNYLKSVLSVQFPIPLHEEVMNAIVILARTNAYFQTHHFSQSFWHVVSDEVGYQGAAVLPKFHVNRAVETTHQATLSYKTAPFPAIWNQNCAGKTTSFASIFRKPFATPQGVDVPLAATDRKASQWSCSIPKERLSEMVHIDEIKAVDLYITPETEKIYGIKITGDSQVKNFSFTDFQAMVGGDILRSNDFTVKADGDSVVFTGFGEGNGVGLCLHSALLMADKGEKADKILNFFFPETKIEKWSTPMIR